MSAAPRIERHAARSASEYRDRILDLWPTAFGPVADEDDWRDRFWEQHRGREGFRLVTAVPEGQGAGADLLGFGWGYVGERGQWWADRVHTALGESGEEWVGGHFEVVELAVRPAERGRGLGGALLDALLEGAAPARALLQTDADPTRAAHRLYTARGWEVLGTLPDGKAVMGAHLRP